MASESKSTGLLKIVSALFLIWAVANILVMLGINSCAGIAGHALLAGLKAKSRTLCNICGTIILILAVVLFLNHVNGDWSLTSIVNSLISVALPVLYFIGVRNAF